ncbi:alanine racemase [Propioniciclava soli]|uniref:alanine racemase n=1 Tax=Propioniciclava soli TaxID=2775081 RepID=UPI001E626A40|nr:alanine racemase [Propioniciclava soli]
MPGPPPPDMAAASTNIASTSTATTDLGAIRHNLAGVRARVGDRLVLAAVKANAYGHGALAVARMIDQAAAADWLGVATAAEALELREAGVRLPMLIFSPVVSDAAALACVRAGVDLTVASADTLDKVSRAAAQAGVPASVHLKVDTGMRRIGCPPDAAPDLARRADAAGLHLRGLFSHLPVSDTEDGRAFTDEQTARFAAVADAVAAARGRVELVHLANSGGVLMHPGTWFDLVRPGVMVYGNLPDPTTDPTVDLRPALRWTTRVSFVKRVAAGETVGYGRTWTAASDTIVATIPVGYGDGYSRQLSNRGRVLVGGRSCPVVGRVCMDQTMVNLGPDASAQVGDEVVLLGEQGSDAITAQELADLMGTITYEVTCLVGARVGRTVSDLS